ncbi:MAG: hypothetical protein KF726_08055 [Anaerolineae bacterium]|nr:hypothetical protein [Anaerolineae bacterium]
MFRKINFRNFVIIAVVLSLSFAANLRSVKAADATPTYNDASGRPAVTIPLADCAGAIVARLVGPDSLWSLLFKVIKPQEGDSVAVVLPGPEVISVPAACR